MRKRNVRLITWHRRASEGSLNLSFEPRDLWIGAFWDFHSYRAEITGSDRWHGEYRGTWALHVYVCLLPLVPLHLYVYRTIRPPRSTS